MPTLDVSAPEQGWRPQWGKSWIGLWSPVPKLQAQKPIVNTEIQIYHYTLRHTDILTHYLNIC